MFKQRIIAPAILLAVSLFLCGQALAHTPLCSCYDNGDGTITCEGGFSDGSSAAGVQMRVKGEDGQVLIEATMDEYSEFTFDKPSGEYSVEFDAGEGHVVEVEGKEIF